MAADTQTISDSGSTMDVIDPHEAAVIAWVQDLAPYGILTTDTELNIRSWNQWLETHSGLAAPTVLGRALFEVFPVLCARKMDEHFRRALAGEVVVLSVAFHEYLLPLPSTVRDSGFAHMQQTARIAPLMMAGRSAGTIVLIEDVTEREAQSDVLSRRHRREQLLAASLAHLLGNSNSETMIEDLFPKLAEFLEVDAFCCYLLDADSTQLRLHSTAGVSKEQSARLLLMNLEDTLCGRAAKQRQPCLVNYVQDSNDPAAQTGKAMGLRAIASNPLMVGDRLIGSLAVGRARQDTFTAEEVEFLSTLSQYVAVALDRANHERALRQAQQDLSDHAHHLEDRVRERTADLRDTIVQLESFSYTVAHDLRAPIRALKGYAQLLLDELPPDGTGACRQHLLRLDRAANRLDALTRDLLQFSSVSRQDLLLASTDVAEILQDLRVLRPELQDEVLIIKEPLQPVLAHRTLLQQCLSNLIDNSLKFIAPGAKPQIVVWTEMVVGSKSSGQPDKTLSPPFIPVAQNPLPDLYRGSAAEEEEEELADYVRIWVEDKGIGIAKESHAKIFGIFERLNGPDEYEGTGIGLAIVARAVQRMGGSCGVESAPGSGSRFWLDLRRVSPFPSR